MPVWSQPAAPGPRPRTLLRRGALRALPSGRPLPEDDWRKRHRCILAILVAQGAGLAVFGMVRGYDPLHTLSEAAVVLASAALAAWPRLGRRARAATATFGLITCSALLVHLSGGMIEAHFHFFIMLGVISLYQDWTAFLLALGFVVVHHGVVGALSPESVYNHPSALRAPWTWALIHGLAVLAASAASLVKWRLNETGRENTEAGLSLLAATLESTADGILVVDATGKITSFNRKFAEMWRIPEEIMKSGSDDAALEHVLAQLAHPEEFIAKVVELYRQPDAHSFDVLEFVDGRVFERYSQPQRVDGVAVGRVWSFRDVTERRRLDELKNSLLSAVSHELRTPLTSVLGFAVTLQQRDGEFSPAQRADVVGRLAQSARKLHRLIEDLLDLDRLSRGIVEPNRVATDVGALVRKIADASEMPAGRLTVDCPAIVARVDPAKTERIVENLLFNAGRHTPPETPLWLRVLPSDDGVLIAVEDAGPGVSDDLKASIFEPFNRGDQVAAHAPGVGIGLSLVAQFARLHGGRAWVEDRAGGGASFRVLLPSGDQGRAAEAAPAA